MQKPLQHFFMYVPPASVVLLKTKKKAHIVSQRFWTGFELGFKKREMAQDPGGCFFLIDFHLYKPCMTEDKTWFASLSTLLEFMWMHQWTNTSPWDFFTFKFRSSYSGMTSEDTKNMLPLSFYLSASLEKEVYDGTASASLVPSVCMNLRAGEFRHCSRTHTHRSLKTSTFSHMGLSFNF